MQGTNSLNAENSPLASHVSNSEIQNIEGLVDELTYISYRTNRDRGIPVDGFRRMQFENVDAMEARYQREGNSDASA